VSATSPGLYERLVFPWLLDHLTSGAEFTRLRRDTLAPACGRVVEIGFGTGASVSLYPSTVTGVVGLDPNPGMYARAHPRTAPAAIPTTLVVGTAEALPLRDECADTAVSLLTLCSVTDPHTTLRELRRVLRHDGRLLLMEHGLSPEPGVARWQHRLDWLESIVACGCHLTRPVEALVGAAGFRFDTVRSFALGGAPRTHGWLTIGTAYKD